MCGMVWYKWYEILLVEGDLWMRCMDSIVGSYEDIYLRPTWIARPI